MPKAGFQQRCFTPWLMTASESDPFSWPQPSVPWSIPEIPIRNPLPVYPPPDDVMIRTPPPALPSPQRQPVIHPSFKVSTHLVPAAYLRTTRYVSPPPASIMPDWSTAKEEKMKKARETIEWMVSKSMEGDLGGKAGYERVLWVCVNRYYNVEKSRRRAGKGLTLFFAHANGFPKETWEPTLKYLLATYPADSVDEIWTWEAVQHGDSALVNEKSLSSIYDWIDNARDILNFFTFFVPSSSSSAALPVHLQRVPEFVSKKRASDGLTERKIVAVGHSFGGCSCTLAALTNSNLFSSLILIDPVILAKYPADDPMTVGALVRRDTWNSKSDALALFKQNPFFSAWEPEILELYVECGLYSTRAETGGGTVKLKTSALQEAVVFSSRQSQQEAYVRLPTLDTKVELRWVMPGKRGAGEFGPPGSTQQRVWLRPENSSNVRIPGAGHLIPQEKPRELAHELGNFLNRTYHSSLRARL